MANVLPVDVQKLVDLKRFLFGLVEVYTDARLRVFGIVTHRKILSKM